MAGGLYTIDFTGKKGSNEQTLQAPFWIDANVLTEPIIYDIDKLVETVDSNGQTTLESQDTRIFDNQYYSNSYKVQIKGVADPLTDIQIIDTKTNKTLCTTVTTEINIFSCNIDFDPNIPVSTSSLKVIATKGQKQVQTSKDTILHIDTQAPNLTAYRNLNNNHSNIVNQYLCQRDGLPIINLNSTSLPQIWCDDASGLPDGFYRQGGDTVEVELQADEELAYGQITNQEEKFRYKLDPVLNSGDRKTVFSPYTAANGIFQIEGYANEGVYTVNLEIADRAGNTSQTTANYIVDNQTPNSPYQDKSLWAKLTGFQRRILEQQVPIDPANPNAGTTNPTGIPSNFQPANNRLLETNNQQNYVLKDNSVVFYGMAEENTYPVLTVNNTDISALESTQTTCSTTDQNNQERPIKKAPDGTITKSNKHCLWKIEVKFEDLYNLLKAKNAP